MSARRLLWRETWWLASRINSSLRLRSFESRSPLGIMGQRDLRLPCHHLLSREPPTQETIGGALDLTSQVMTSTLRVWPPQGFEGSLHRGLRILFGSESSKQVNNFERKWILWLRTSDSPLSEKITSHRFPKKFIMPNFKCYSGVTDPIQHLRQYQDKMAVYSHDDLLLSRVFSSILKGVTYDWLFSLLRHSLWSFKEVKQSFYHQYASRRKHKKNNNYLLTIKTKPREKL